MLLNMTLHIMSWKTSHITDSKLFHKYVVSSEKNCFCLVWLWKEPLLSSSKLILLCDVGTDVVEGGADISAKSVSLHPLVQVAGQLVWCHPFHPLEFLFRLCPVALYSLCVHTGGWVHEVLAVVHGLEVVGSCGGGRVAGRLPTGHYEW